MTTEIPVCPECDTPRIRSQVRGMSSRAASHEWHCKSCGAWFDAAHWRERKRDWTTHPAEKMLKRAGVEDPEAAISRTREGGGAE